MVGTTWLRNPSMLASVPGGAIQDLVDRLSAATPRNSSLTTGEFSTIAECGIISEDARSRLIQLVDARHLEYGNASEDATDFKLELSLSQLASIVGTGSVSAVTELLGAPASVVVKIRRVTADGGSRVIPFHIDAGTHSSVLQIALNPDTEYVGGRLVYAVPRGNDSRFVIPERLAGAVTVHNDKIVHGVTALVSGIRYSLFLLA